MKRKKLSFTTGEVAEFCGVNFRTVIRWIKNGELESYKLPGRGDNRIPRQEVMRFLEASKIPIPDDLLGEEQSGPPHILIVEDEESVANAISRLLVRKGYKVTIAQDGFKAGVILAAEKPNLMTVDLRMPMLDGIGVLKHIRDHDLRIPVLVVSAGTKDEFDQAVKLGAKATLSKPFENSELLEIIDDLLEKG